MFFEFNQNNSGGSFVMNDKVCHWMFVEADNEESACEFAENLGCYFNGTDNGDDCPCCGDRWSRPWEKTEFPLEYGDGTRFENPEEYCQYLIKEYGWFGQDTVEARVFYKDGRVAEFYGKC